MNMHANEGCPPNVSEPSANKLLVVLSTANPPQCVRKQTNVTIREVSTKHKVVEVKPKFFLRYGPEKNYPAKFHYTDRYG